MALPGLGEPALVLDDEAELVLSERCAVKVINPLENRQHSLVLVP